MHGPVQPRQSPQTGKADHDGIISPDVSTGLSDIPDGTNPLGCWVCQVTGRRHRLTNSGGQPPETRGRAIPERGGNVRIGPGGSRSLFFRAIRRSRRFGGVARSIAEGLAGAASAPAQCRPGIGHPPVGCLYPQITAEEERAALDGADGGRDIGLLTGNTRCLVVQGPGRAAADDLGYQRRARGAWGDPGPLPAIEYLREPAQALAEMPASLRVEVHSDLAALVGLPRPWPG